MRRNGERIAVLIFEAPLVDGAGRHTGWMSAVLDVSAQRRVEELSRQQQERLQATARLATVGEMASLLSHELNQPLAAIASYAAGSLNLLQAGAPDAETATMLQQAAQRIAEQAERAGRVIKSVHDFVRRREQARESVRVDVLFDAVLPLVRLQARKSGTRIEVELPEPPPRVLCDRTMIEQVLLNLTRNGIQAMESHAEIGAAGAAHAGAAGACALGRVRCHRRRPGHCGRRGAAPVHAVFHDPQRGHGPGPELVPHRDRTAWRRARFPEPLARHRVSIYAPGAGGRRGPEAPDRGAAGSHRCCMAPPPEPTPPMSPTSTSPLGLPMVYLVDDEDVVRDALAWLLRSRRLLSEGFASAEAFEAMLAAKPPAALAEWPPAPSCLVLDVRMPGMSGLLLFERLAQLNVLGALPVIFLTGHGDVPTAVAAVKRGAFDFVEKPFSDNALVDRIEQALKHSEAAIRARLQRAFVRAPTGRADRARA